MNEKRCGDCNYWCDWLLSGGTTGVPIGACHRYPPNAIPGIERQGLVEGKTNAVERAEWPLVNIDNWCGEWKEKVREEGKKIAWIKDNLSTISKWKKGDLREFYEHDIGSLLVEHERLRADADRFVTLIMTLCGNSDARAACRLILRECNDWLCKHKENV